MNEHLNNHYKNEIKKFNNNNNNILLLSGDSGSGKTSFGEFLLKNTIMTRLDSYDIKNKFNFQDYISDIINNNNITIMFNKKKKKRSLLIDDIHIIYKYDKILFKNIINFFNNNKKINNIKIIIICNLKFITNKNFKIKNKLYNIINIYINKNINYPCINYNDNKDIYYDYNTVIIKLNEQKISYDEIDKMINNLNTINDINLSLIDNLYLLFSKNKYKLNEYIKIYDLYQFIDIIDTYGKINNYNMYQYNNIILYYINLRLNNTNTNNNNIVYNNITYNKYISKTLSLSSIL